MQHTKEQCGDYSRLATIFLIVVRSKDRLSLAKVQDACIKSDKIQVLKTTVAKQMCN